MSTRIRTVLVINPNSNADTTAMMCRFAREQLPEMNVVGATAEGGPRMILDPVALDESRRYVTEQARRGLAAHTVDAVVVAAIGDPGRAELADQLDVPVIGIGMASVIAAAAGGRPFAMATSTPLLAASLASLADEHGGGAPFRGVELTESEPTVLAADPERQFAELRACVQRCAANGAESVIIAGGPLSETARRLAALDLARIVEPIPAAASLVRAALAR
ncbi:aspartate/glutamate racemase family protein [Microbacterium sp. 22242]|uniref:aspartate/glutamate racemase family protein n=1 Tax=Microbacterium sp. 22242 TaxID=3453896 RepID=UPI003F87A2CC